jgi:phosphoglycolate phosphatase-like HAD superfamily hydrolase
MKLRSRKRNRGSEKSKVFSVYAPILSDQDLGKSDMKLRIAGSAQEIDLIVFDCDGVLLDTMSAKIEAFRAWIPEMHAEHAEAFMDRVMHGFGTSRERHIESFYHEFVGTHPPRSFLKSEVDRFTGICEPLCADAGWLRGSMDFVAGCRQEGVLCYVLSGTPQKPLEEMLRSNGGGELFNAILGSPPAKPQGMERILEETGVPPERTVFIGDANADRLAAEHVGAHFVYLPSQAARPGGRILTEVSDLRELRS